MGSNHSKWKKWILDIQKEFCLYKAVLNPVLNPVLKHITNPMSFLHYEPIQGVRGLWLISMRMLWHVHMVIWNLPDLRSKLDLTLMSSAIPFVFMHFNQYKLLALWHMVDSPTAPEGQQLPVGLQIVCSVIICLFFMCINWSRKWDWNWKCAEDREQEHGIGQTLKGPPPGGA